MLNNEVTIKPVVRNYKPRKPKTEEQKQMALSTVYRKYKELKEEHEQLLNMAKGVIPTPDPAVIENLQKELNLANNKVTELAKIVESMKGQYAQLEKEYNDMRLKNKATLEYMIDSIKHTYISATMAAKGGV